MYVASRLLDVVSNMASNRHSNTIYGRKLNGQYVLSLGEFKVRLVAYQIRENDTEFG